MLDGTNATFAKQHGENLFHHAAARQHVRHAAWHAQIVFEYHELAVWHPNQIGSADAYVNVARDLEAAHLSPISRAGIDELTGDHAVLDDPAIMVDVFQE